MTTKTYIISTDKVLNTVDASSTYPVQSAAIKSALDQKVSIVSGKGLSTNDYTNEDKAIVDGVTTALAGKVDKDGEKQLSTEDYTTAEKTKLSGIAEGAEVNVKANWVESDTTSDAYIENKPFNTIGTGLTVTSGVLSADTQFKFQIFETLPTASATYAQTIALVLKAETETGNLYTEYACVNVSTSETEDWKWEQIGETKFELSISQTASGITINSTALQTASAAQTGLLSSTDFTTFNGKQDTLTFDSTPTESSTNPVTSGGIKTALDAKVDVVYTAAEDGYIAKVDSADHKLKVMAAGTPTVAFANITGEVADNAKLSTALAGKADVTGSDAFKIGHDSNGFYFETE